MGASRYAGAHSSTPSNGRFEPVSEIRERLLRQPTTGSNESNSAEVRSTELSALSSWNGAPRSTHWRPVPCALFVALALFGRHLRAALSAS